LNPRTPARSGPEPDVVDMLYLFEIGTEPCIGMLQLSVGSLMNLKSPWVAYTDA